MPIKLLHARRARTADTKTATVVFGDESMDIEFRIGAISPRKMTAMQNAPAEQQLETTADFLEGVLSKWDVIGEDGKALPITRDVMLDLPVDFLGAIATAINDAVNVPKETMSGSFAG